MAHIPVMLREVMEALRPAEGEVAVDGTAGAGGHSLHLARAVGKSGKLIAVDRDPAMAAIARETLSREFEGEEGRRFIVATAPYHNIAEVLAGAGCAGADAVLLDVGMNSLQVDDPSRGMSFRHDGPLDGRFNPNEPGTISIAELVNTADERDLAKWIFEYADERNARSIAAAICRERRTTKFETTSHLSRIVTAAIPARDRAGKIDPATRTMQALRIVVNSELELLEAGLHACLAALNPGGRMAVISFHSGEDRLVKRVFDEAGSPRPDPGNPYSATSTKGLDFEVARRGAVKPTEEEIAVNPRSRSARLRSITRKGGRA